MMRFTPAELLHLVRRIEIFWGSFTQCDDDYIKRQILLMPQIGGMFMYAFTFGTYINDCNKKVATVPIHFVPIHGNDPFTAIVSLTKT